MKPLSAIIPSLSLTTERKNLGGKEKDKERSPFLQFWVGGNSATFLCHLSLALCEWPPDVSFFSFIQHSLFLDGGCLRERKAVTRTQEGGRWKNLSEFLDKTR